MYGGHSKLGGGGRGGGGNKRPSSSLPPPPPHRSAGNSRLSLGGGGPSNPRNSRPGTAKTPAAVEEKFSLLPGNNPPAFAMIIRLAPDLVDEIKKLQSHGGNPRIKFDAMANNTTGNVIDVGGKEFRFTWSREFGDLCDIYEERQSGEDGNGLLVESGCAWRKVNVQRTLDESATNHVKKLSEEAERKLKSRKAIVLDHGNPAAKSQIKQLAAVESNPWRGFKQKKDPPFKKRKVESTPVAIGGVSKSSFKPGPPPTIGAKGKPSSSPLSSPPEQSGDPTSPFATGSFSKSTKDITPTQMKTKENVARSEPPAKAAGAPQEKSGQKRTNGAKPTDLQSLLVSLLIQNPKGMSLKALEKAVGDTFPNSAKKIVPIVDKIADLKAPGRYFLKPGMESESFKKPSSESGSSPEDNHQQLLAPGDGHDQRHTTESRLANKNPTSSGGSGEAAQLENKLAEESNTLENVSVQHRSPDLFDRSEGKEGKIADLFGEKKVSENSEGQAGSSSDSGSDSDSDSDSSDSGSDSGSRSRSRSPAGSGSGSSSDSDSDASSSSKEGSDEDVDIMTSDDEKETRHDAQPSQPGLSTPLEPWRPMQNEMDERQDGDGSDAVDIDDHGSDAVDIEDLGSDAVDIVSHGYDPVDVEKDLANVEKEVEKAVDDSLLADKEVERPLAGSFSSDLDRIQEREALIGNLFDDNDNVAKENFRPEVSDSSERTSVSKSKRGHAKQDDEKSERVKRWKGESLTPEPVSRGRDAQPSENSHGKHTEDTCKDPSSQMTNGTEREGSADFGIQKGYNQAFTGKSSGDLKQPGRRPPDQSAWSKATDAAGRSKYSESSGHGRKFSEKGPESFPVQREKGPRDTPNEDRFVKDKKFPRNPREGGTGGRHSAPSDSPYKKQGEIFGKVKDSAPAQNSHVGSSPKGRNRNDMGKHPVGSEKVLQRELSDLELGELREPLLEETPTKKQFEKKGSFKLSESKTSTSDNCSSDLSKRKPGGQVISDSGKPSPNVSAGIKRSPERGGEDLTRSHNKVVQPQAQQLSRVDNAEFGSQISRLADTTGRLRQNEARSSLGNGVEGSGESNKKAPVSGQQLVDSKPGTLSQSRKESRSQRSNSIPDLIDRQKDIIPSEGNRNARKRRESSSEDDNSSYSKYEKDAPELKGPIKDFIQYREYVQEYRDKYDSYCSLNKILENYRNEFHKLGTDLDSAKGRDMERYQKTLVQLKESYRQCGMRHKRLKKIFIVLHKELEQLKQRIRDFAHSYTKD
ncbi:hypothetical protein Tsubulata_037741 [Turnera subulata]|uniref:OCEL domain-containing protein n=1 Tax=Turnera subulata TaxID=218843 RepID=A0A9Q0GKQ8_9ROSI|nr:hypothetical protein Tsubulata_037741 [Turnera subulata]